MTTIVRCVVCAYDMEPVEVVAQLDQIGKRNDVEYTGIVIDNRRRSSVKCDRWEFHDGSNALMDFSAYVEGAHYSLQSNATEPVLFINDSLFTRHNAQHHLRRLIPHIRHFKRVAGPAVAGKVDRYVDQCFKNPWSGVDAYVSTFCFLATPEAIRVLIACYESIDSVIGIAETPIESPDWGVGLAMQFREFLRSHVTQENMPSAWYQAARYRDNPEMVRKKARCVYLEHRLSGEIGREGLIFSVYPTPRAQLTFLWAERIAKVRRTFKWRSRRS